jgi:putative membrane protein
MYNVHRMLVIIGCGWLCASASAAGVQAPRKFLASTMQDGMAEIAECRLALQKSTDPAVKSFAERMIKDHSSIDDAIVSLAQAKHYKLPDSPNLKQKASYDLLKARSGAGFDQAFMKHNVSDHEKDIKDFKKEADGSSDADIRSFASATLKTLQEHLELSRKVNSEITTAHK